MRYIKCVLSCGMLPRVFNIAITPTKRYISVESAIPSCSRIVMGALLCRPKDRFTTSPTESFMIYFPPLESVRCLDSLDSAHGRKPNRASYQLHTLVCRDQDATRHKEKIRSLLYGHKFQPWEDGMKIVRDKIWRD